LRFGATSIGLNSYQLS